ncbi:MAG: hypothetical protein D8M59_05740 [Planctomycetes bacterium]|nr:hypothetical protein [Planctomycetota bacterium]
MSQGLQAQQDPEAIAIDWTVTIPVITSDAEAPTIDGVLDEVVWETAVVIDCFTQVDPNQGEPPTQRTEMRLLYDQDHLYVAFRCYDTDPDGIVVSQLQRDRSLDTDDNVRFVIDPYFDRRNGYYFSMNPVGCRRDAEVVGNRNLRTDWDGIWYGRSSMDEQGWCAEFSIPFKTISMNPNTSRWSFNAERYVRRNHELNRWASPARNIDIESVGDAGVIEGLHELDQGVGLDFVPYTLATLKRDHDRNQDGLDLDAGFDLFYKVTPSLTASLTVNTDFAETEVDDRRVNLTRFPLFFPEKRDFFLQDAGIFEFGGIRQNPLPYHSRRIGIGPGGAPQDILAGLKLTGRVGDLNLGLLDVQMKHDQELGDKNLFVGRASVNVFDQSAIGAIFTHGDPLSTEDNSMGGVDFLYRDTHFNGNKIVQGSAWGLLSDSSDQDSIQGAYGFKLGYPNSVVDWEVGYTEISNEFDAALGFVPRKGIREYFGNWSYTFRPKKNFIRTIESGVDGYLITDLDNNVETQRITLNVADFRSQRHDQLRFSYSFEREVIDSNFRITRDVTIPAGDYTNQRYMARLLTSRGKPFIFGFQYEGGGFYSGLRNDYLFQGEWRVSPNLHIGADYLINDVDLAEGDFITRIIRGRLNILFTPDITWTTFVQYDSVSQSAGINSKLQWIVQPGNTIYLVLNQDVQRYGSDQYRLSSSDLTTKIGWTFRF